MLISLGLLLLVTVNVFAQVKPNFIYNTGMPYGILDLRTRISSSDYYYLVEGKTFGFRENAGVRTEKYLDMTNWDSSPYNEGHMRHRKGSSDDFVMNYRLLFPANYQRTYSNGYPMIVLMHGAVERGNCYFDDCYHGDWSYDPNTNAPPAPTVSDHKLLNNDHHLAIGASQHLAARNRAGGKLPDDPALEKRAFPGFVLMAQMFNDWDSIAVENVIRMVRLHIEEHNIDPDRIYIHGLSIGGYATYEAIKRAPWLFAAALPMSAVREAGNIFTHNQQGRVSHIPLWIFQGGKDNEPTVEWTANVRKKLKAAGSSVRYSEYADLGHNVWNRAYAEADFFSWMLKQNKANIHAQGGNRVVNYDAGTYPELVLAEGFFAYQWEKDGQTLSSATGHKLVAKDPGIYRARFSRVSSPSSSDWNQWSPPVTITSTGNEQANNGDEDNEGTANDQDTGNSEGDEDNGETGGEDSEQNDPVTALSPDVYPGIFVYPNPGPAELMTVTVEMSSRQPFEYTLVDPLGRHIISGSGDESNAIIPISAAGTLHDGVYIILVRQEKNVYQRRILIRN